MAWTSSLLLIVAGLYAAPALPGPHPLPGVTVEFRIGGETYVARLPEKRTEDTWLSGALVTEWRSTVSPIRSDGTEHLYLRVLFDVRSYADGQGRLDVTVENTLDKADATTLTYDVDIRIGNQTLWHRTGVTHYYLTRWRKIIPLDLTAAQVTPDLETFYQARALPRYGTLVGRKVDSPSGVRFEILQGGDLHAFMPDHGGRPELAPYPDWTARYLAHRQPLQEEYVLAHGDLAGSWPIHVREASDGRFVSIDERPEFWFDARARAGDKPAGSPLPGGEQHGPSASPLIPDNNHVPSLAYVPYLLTGDRYYAEEMKFWANYGLLNTYQDRSNRRGGSKGLLYVNEVRGFGWVLRNLADAAAYLPDADPLKKYFAQKVANNLNWLDEWSQTRTGPLGVAWIKYQTYEPDSRQAKNWIKMWQYNYLTWAIDHANDQGIGGGLAYRDQVGRFQLSLFSSPDFRREYAATYGIPVADRAGSSPRNYASLHEVFANISPRGKYTPFAGHYGVDARLVLLIGIKNGWNGARQTHDWLLPQIRADLATRSGWAIEEDSEQNESAIVTQSKDIRALYRLTNGWTTFGIALPSGAARTALRIGGLDTQTDVKTRWPDGSIRFAVLTAAIPKSGLYRVGVANQ